MAGEEVTVELKYDWKYGGDEYWPYNGMVNDLYRGVQSRCNFSTALGLVVLTEVIGGKILDKPREYGDGKGCFREFAQNYMGYRFDDWGEVYGRVRNGLAHNYAMKAKQSVAHMDDGTHDCGIEFSRGDKITIHVKSYFQHFVAGLEKYLDEAYGNAR